MFTDAIMLYGLIESKGGWKAKEKKKLIVFKYFHVICSISLYRYIYIYAHITSLLGNKIFFTKNSFVKFVNKNFEITYVKYDFFFQDSHSIMVNTFVEIMCASDI